MTPAERQALREKHRQYGFYCFICGGTTCFDPPNVPCERRIMEKL